MYLTRKKRIGRGDELDELASLSGEVWSDITARFWRTVRKKDHWLSKGDLKRWICQSSRYPGLQSHTIQAVARQFYWALDGWRKKRSKEDESAKPPKSKKKWNKVVWDSTGISFRDGELRLSRGRGHDPLTFDWDHPEPKRVEMIFDESIKEYVLCCQYEVEPEDRTSDDRVAGIDLGLKHLAAVEDGEKCFTFNGGEVRSKQRYLNKIKAELDSRIDRRERGSNRWWKLVQTKREQSKKIRNQISDILHKTSRQLVEMLLERRVSTLIMGDVRGIRDDLDYGSRANQQLHQWVHGRLRRMIAYKARLAGMEVEMVDEAYTSQTCPSCGAKNKLRDRNYDCPECEFSGHRDAVGAINIRQKYLREGAWSDDRASEKPSTEVVGDRVSPSGIRFNANAPCSSSSGSKTFDEKAAVQTRESR